MIKGELGKTRKYPVGSTHEIVSGKFVILDRYVKEDGKRWLKYEWITGKKQGQIEENKEENINVSTYKFRRARTVEIIQSEADDVQRIYERTNECHKMLQSILEQLSKIQPSRDT